VPAAAFALKPYAAGPKELFALPRFTAGLDRPAAATPGDRDAAAPDCLELPRPTALLRTIGWNIAESFGLPTGAYVLAAWLGGRDAGLWAMLAAIWLTAVIRKLATGSVPGLVAISLIVLTVQTLAAIITGNLWIFLLHFPLANLALCLLFARTAPTGKPLVAQLAAEVVALRQPSAAHPGLDRFFRGVTWLWAGIFAASTIGLVILLAVEPVPVFLLFTTVVTVAGVAAGTGLSVLWFVRMLRRCDLRVRFGPA
jgi:uncharacterized membrane protein